MDPQPLRGCCYCGGVRFEVAGRPGPMGHCHCSRCRKSCGAAFHTSLLVRDRHFVWLAGRDLVGSYVPEAPFTIVRDFCRVCGCYLGELLSVDPKVVSGGILEGDPGRRPQGHEWISSKVPWFGVSDGLPCFGEGFPPEEAWRDRETLSRRSIEPPPAVPGHRPETSTRGSCICGEVEYEFDGELAFVLHCHCVDCRRAQGCDFTTNGSVAAADFRLLRGDESLRSYQSSPGKNRFFCGRCGASLFSRRKQAGTPVVRLHLGSLDDDPGVRPAAQIWISEGQPWQVLQPGLRTFEKSLSGPETTP